MSSTNDGVAGRSAPNGPFLCSDPSQPPLLAPIECPTGAVAAATQQITSQPVDLPFNRVRDPKRVYANAPKPRASSLAFKTIWEGFASARRLTSPKGVLEAGRMAVAEAQELVDYKNKVVVPDNSLPCRSVAVQLLIPTYCGHTKDALTYLDAMAALSDGTTHEGKPITTLVRFAVYGDEAACAMERVLMQESFDRKSIDGVSLILRWAEDGVDGVARVRSESAALSRSDLHQDPAAYIQSVAVGVAAQYGAALPSAFFLPTKKAVPGFYEMQIVQAADEFCRLMHKKDAFQPTEAMVAVGCTRLVPVGGMCARMSPNGCGIDGVTSNSAFHALLLCAEGQEEAARSYALSNREGLPPPRGPGEERMFLHTLAVQAEHLFLNDMVSLYGPNGKPGEPIQSPGTWIWRSSSAILPLEVVMRNFYVMSCSAQSLVPGRRALAPFMDMHFKHAMELYHSSFGNEAVDTKKRGLPKKDTKGFANSVPPCPEDAFVLAALGVDLCSKRLCLGEVIAHLTCRGGAQNLVDVLVNMATKIGLSASLSDTFGHCLQCIKSEDEASQMCNQEIRRLKRVADAALVMNCSRKAQKAEVFVSPAHVRKLLKVLDLQAGKTAVRVDSVGVVPRGLHISEAVGLCVAQAARVDLCAHRSEITNVINTHGDIIVAVSKAMRLATMDSAPKVRAFVMVHGHQMSSPCIGEVMEDASLHACGVGSVFEADAPALVVVKFRSEDSCLITPLLPRGQTPSLKSN